MKKTRQTAMTAALFAAAMNAVPSGALGTVTANASSADLMTSAASAIVYNPKNDESYGVYGPAPNYGDVNYDGVVDVFDLICLRQAYINGESKFSGDVNYDGKFNVADLVTLQKYLLGQIDDVMNNVENESSGTTQITDITHTETVTTSVTAPMFPVYGPPYALD